MPRKLVQISSFTMACTGSIRETTGTQAPGTTDLGVSLAQRRCRCTSCASRCATTGTLLPTSAAGGRMRRHAGAITGVMTGRTSAADGTDGTVHPLLRQRRCLPTSASIPGSDIRIRWRSNGIFTTRTTVTSRVMSRYGRMNRRLEPEQPPEQINRIGRGCLSRKAKGHRRPSALPRLHHISR
jgi:hypothetical protein